MPRFPHARRSSATVAAGVTIIGLRLHTLDGDAVQIDELVNGGGAGRGGGVGRCLGIRVVAVLGPSMKDDQLGVSTLNVFNVNQTNLVEGL